MEDAYYQFYEYLYTEIKDHHNIKIHKHPILAPQLIKTIIDKKLSKHQDFIPYQHLIKATFGFDTSRVTPKELLTLHDIDEGKFDELINQFIRSLLTSIYYRRSLLKVFFSYLVGFSISVGIISAYTMTRFFDVFRDNILIYTVAGILIAAIFPFISFSESYVSRYRKNLLSHYEHL